LSQISRKTDDKNDSNDLKDCSSQHAEKITVEEVTIDKKSDPSSPPEEPKYLSGLRFWLIMLALAAVSALTALGMNIVATAVPRMTDYFHTVIYVGWYASAFRLCFCALQFQFGKAYTLFSVKRVFLLSNLIWITGIVLCGAANSPIMFIIGRAGARLGTSGLSSGGTLILVHTISVHRRPVYQGHQAAIEGISVLAGPLLGGFLTQYLTWRWCFYINLPFGVVYILLTTFCFADRQPPPSNTTWEKVLQLDILSNLLVIPALTCLFLA
jgi:MFS family permease